MEKPHVTCNAHFCNLATLFQSKVVCVNLVWIGLAFQENQRYLNFQLGAENPYWGGGGGGCYM